jgi:hypothetical protein
MFEFIFQVVDVLKSNGKNAAVLFLSYGTSTSLPTFPLIANAIRSRTRRSLPPTTPASSCITQPRPDQARNLTQEYNTHRRLGRRPPGPLPFIPHIASAPLNHRPYPTNLPIRASSRHSPNLTLGMLLQLRRLLQNQCLQRLYRSAGRQTMERCIPRRRIPLSLKIGFLQPSHHGAGELVGGPEGPGSFGARWGG